MNFCSIFIIFALCANGLNNTECATRYNVVGQKIVCEINPKFIYNVTCDLIRNNQNRQQYTIDAHMVPNVRVDNFYAKFSQLRKENGKYKPYMGISNVTIDICAFLSNSGKSFLMDLAAGAMKKYYRPFRPCPIYERVWANDIILDDLALPSIVIPGEFFSQLIGYTKINGSEEMTAKIRLYTQIKIKK